MVRRGQFLESIYLHHRYLANPASYRIGYGNLLLEREDVRQELEIKLFTSMKSYFKKAKRDIKIGFVPIPLEIYLRTVINNRIRDILKQSLKTEVRYDHTQHDFHVEEHTHESDLHNFILFGVNLLDFDDETPMRVRMCLKIFFKGYKKSVAMKKFNLTNTEKKIFEKHLTKIKLLLDKEI